MIQALGVRMSHLLLTAEQTDLAKRWHAPAIARILIQRQLENKGHTFSHYDIPNGSGFTNVVRDGHLLGLWDSTIWASVWQCTPMAIPWAERCIEAEKIFSESPEADAIRLKILKGFK